MKYNQCLERLAKGKEPHCEGSKGRLESYRQQEADWADRASATSTNTATALLDQAKTMEKDERNYHPLVNAIREFFHVSGTIGSFLLSLTLISFFEYAFHYLGGRYAQAKAKLVQQGYDVTRKLRQPPRKHDGSMTTFSEQDNNTPTPQNDKPQGKPEYLLDSRWPTTPETSLQAMKKEFRGMVESAPAVIANEYARAQQSREQVYQKAADKLDGVQDGLNKAKAEKTLRQEYREGGKVYSDSPLDQPRPTAGKTFEELREKDGPELQQAVYEEFQDLRMPLPAMLKRIHADVLASGATSPADIQATVKAAYLNIANPTPMNKTMLQTVARNISKQMDNTISSQAAPTLPIDQQPGRTGLHNPVLGTAEEHYSLPLDRPTPAQAPASQERAETTGQLGIPSDQNTQPGLGIPSLDGNLQAVADDLYPAWKAAVKTKAITHAKDPCQKFIWKATAPQGEGKQVLSAPETARIWSAWQERAASEGILNSNPKYHPGNRQPKYILA